MKKIVLCTLVMALLIPVSLFAVPSEDDVSEAVGAVMAVYGMSIMVGMLGGDIYEETLTMEMSEDGMQMTMHYKNFPAKEFLESMMGYQEEDDQIECPFDILSGEIIGGNPLSEEIADLKIDVQMQGGKIKTLEMYISEEENMLKANGHRYADIENILDEVIE